MRQRSVWQGGHGPRGAVLVLAVLAGACASAAPRAGGDPGGVRVGGDARARAVLARGLDALGGPDLIARVGGIVVEGEGTHDLGVRLQGMRPGPGDRYPLRERLGVVPEEGRTVYEARGRINPDADEWLRHDIRADHGYWIDLLGRRAYAGGPDGRAGYERAVPHLLLEEALRPDAAPRWLGRGEAALDLVMHETGDGVPLTLGFDPVTGLLRTVEYRADLPLRGETRVRWSYGEYREVAGIGPYPSSYAVDLGDERLREVTITSVTAAASSDLFTVPSDIALPPPPTSTPATAAPDRYDIRELAPGVHLFVSLRGGFHMLFVEFEDHVLAVDAPAGWHELHQLPPASVADAPADALGERYLDGIRATVPGKPVRYVVLTHAHSDHAGGVPAFVRAGATVLGAGITRGAVTRALANRPDAGMDDAPALRFEAVEDQRILADGTMEVRVLDVGPNPHAEGMLAVYLPRHRILYVVDLFEPASPATFPSPARVPIMRWFVDWLDRSGLEPDQIFAVHGSARVTTAQLDGIRALGGAP